MTLQCLPDGTINPAWVREHQGKIGGSKIANIMPDGVDPDTKKKSASRLSQGALTLARQLALERFYGWSFNNVDPNNPDIQRGNEHEPIALAEYEIQRGVLLSPARWLHHPKFDMAGSTPDAFCGLDGLVQVKCPRREKYGLIIASGERPTEHDEQMQWELACTGREWNDLAIFCADFPPGQRLWVRLVYRDEVAIAKMEAKVEIFLAEVDAIFERLKHVNFTGAAA